MFQGGPGHSFLLIFIGFSLIFNGFFKKIKIFEFFDETGSKIYSFLWRIRFRGRFWSVPIKNLLKNQFFDWIWGGPLGPTGYSQTLISSGAPGLFHPPGLGNIEKYLQKSKKLIFLNFLTKTGRKYTVFYGESDSEVGFN